MRAVFLGAGAALLVATSAFAQTEQSGPQDARAAQPSVQNPPDGRGADEADEQENNRRSFAGLGFGVGLSVTFDAGGLERISAAEVVNGVVRVSDEDDTRARVMLESHYFFRPESELFGLDQTRDNWGFGPFVAVQPGTDEIIEAAALGIMIGFREGDSSNSFNIGVGIAVDPNTQTLGDGIVRDLPLPAGESAIRYKEESQYGLIVLFSQSF